MRENGKWILLLVGVCVLVFANSVGGEFVYDDLRQIVRNPLIQDNSLIWQALTSDVWAFKGDGTQAASNYWRPTFTFFNIIAFRVFALEPAGWHVLNLLLHSLVCVVAYFLLRRWEFSAGLAFVITLIFAVHPVHVESVAWIAGSPDLLFGLAFLGSLWFATRYRESSSWADLALAIFLYAVALGAKEIGIVCLPIYYLALAARDQEIRTTLRDPLLIGIGLTAVVYFAVRWMILGAISHPPDDAVSTMDAVLSIPMMFTFYLRQIFAPVWLAVNYPLTPVTDLAPLTFWLPLLIMLAALAGLIYLSRSSRKARLAVAIFILPMLPALNATAFISEQMVHDRYLYLPLLGVLMLVVLLAARSVGERSVFVAGVLIATILAVQTVRYNSAWENDLALWTWTSDVDDSAFTSMQYATALSGAGRNEEALRAYSTALEKRPAFRGFLGRGQILLTARRYDEAERDLLSALALPAEKQDAYGTYQVYEALGIAYLEQQKYDAAIDNFTKARSILPIYAAALTEKLAVALYQAGRKDEALRELENAREQSRRELLPESKNIFLRLGMLYAEQDRKNDARAALNEFLALTESSGDKVIISSRTQARKLLERLK